MNNNWNMLENEFIRQREVDMTIQIKLKLSTVGKQYLQLLKHLLPCASGMVIATVYKCILISLIFAWLTTQNIYVWISVFYAWWYYHNSVLRKIDNGSSLFYYIYDHYFQLTAHYMYRDIIWSFSTDSLFPSSECEMDTINGCYIFLLLIGWKD